MISFETKTKIEELEKKYKDVLSVVNEDEINKELEEVEKNSQIHRYGMIKKRRVSTPRN